MILILAYPGNQDGCALTTVTFRRVEWESELYRGVMRARCYPWNMPKHRFHKMNPQVIPCYPWLYTYIKGYSGISLANDAAPGLLLDSPALPVQPGGPLCYVLGGAWHARPQLFFKCILRPQNGRPPKNPSWTRGPDGLEATLVFFSTFEELKLPATGPMDRATRLSTEIVRVARMRMSRS